MEDFFDVFDADDKSNEVVSGNDVAANRRSRIDIRYNRTVTKVTQANKVGEYKVKQWPTIDTDSGFTTNALGISLEAIERKRAVFQKQQNDLQKEQERKSILDAHEILDEELEDMPEDGSILSTPNITVEELEKIRQDAFEEGKSQGFAKGHEEGVAKGLQEGQEQGFNQGLTQGQEQGYQEGFAKGQNEGFISGQNQGLELGQKIVLEQAERFRYLADRLANPLRQVDKEVTDEIAYIISRLVKVITKKEIEHNASFLTESIKHALSLLPNAQKGATITLNPDDLAIVQASLGSEYLAHEHYQLKEDPSLQIGDVIVNNEQSLIEWRIDERIDTLLSDFLKSVYPSVQSAAHESIEGCPEYDEKIEPLKVAKDLEDLKVAANEGASAQEIQAAPEVAPNAHAKVVADNQNLPPQEVQVTDVEPNPVG